MITLWVIGWGFTVNFCTPEETLKNNTMWQNAKNDLNYLLIWPLQLGTFCRKVFVK
jgi:GH24 family phage-related lysozyme (muramidase)